LAFTFVQPNFEAWLLSILIAFANKCYAFCNWIIEKGNADLSHNEINVIIILLFSCKCGAKSTTWGDWQHSSISIKKTFWLRDAVISYNPYWLRDGILPSVQFFAALKVLFWHHLVFIPPSASWKLVLILHFIDMETDMLSDEGTDQRSHG
jgi:hypothetical protein